MWAAAEGLSESRPVFCLVISHKPLVCVLIGRALWQARCPCRPPCASWSERQVSPDTPAHAWGKALEPGRPRHRSSHPWPRPWPGVLVAQPGPPDLSHSTHTALRFVDPSALPEPSRPFPRALASMPHCQGPDCSSGTLRTILQSSSLSLHWHEMDHSPPLAGRGSGHKSGDLGV